MTTKKTPPLEMTDREQLAELLRACPNACWTRCYNCGREQIAPNINADCRHCDRSMGRGIMRAETERLHQRAKFTPPDNPADPYRIRQALEAEAEPIAEHTLEPGAESPTLRIAFPVPTAPPAVQFIALLESVRAEYDDQLSPAELQAAVTWLAMTTRPEPPEPTTERSRPDADR